MATPPRPIRANSGLLHRARLLVPPEARGPLLFLRDRAAERAGGWALLGVLVLTPWPRPARRSTPLTDDQAEAVTAAELRLVREHAVIGLAASWLGPGVITGFVPDGAWVARQLVDHLALPIRLRW